MNYYIETYGCQMNEYDSDLIKYDLNKNGFKEVKNAKNADVIMLNTCAVRKSAENRVYGQLGHMKRIKKDNNSIIGVVGCMAQKEAENLIDDVPHVDFVLGTAYLDKIISTIRYINDNRNEKIVKTDLDKPFVELEDIPHKEPQKEEFVSIMRGCNNFCTYCIVPYVRGRERSRNYKNIIKEVKYLVNNGTKEINLLGQNVNSYIYDNVEFLDLVKKIALIDGVKRIRFTTSHPKDMTPEIIKELLNIDKVCNHFHLPLQAGSNKILKKMNRNYSIEHYLPLIDTIRENDKYASITTDIIVGFTDETDKDFAKTLNTVKYVEFDSAFVFKYNPRPKTKGYELPDNVSDKIKQKRLEKLNKVVKRTAKTRNKLMVGKEFEILVTEKGRKSKKQYKGRTKSNKIVVFDTDKDVMNKFVNVKIKRAAGWTLFGKLKNIKGK